MPDNDLRYVCTAGEIPVGGGKAFSIAGPDGSLKVAVFNVGGQFYATSNVCIHQGGPLSEGRLDGDVVTCPWHGWQYSVVDGKSAHEGGDSVDSYPVQVSEGKVYVNPVPSGRGRKVFKPHRAYQELDGAVKQHLANMKSAPLPVDVKVRVLGISTTNTDKKAPRNSTSEAALQFALDHAKSLGADTVMVKLRDLEFKHCEGYYSKDARACIFPCSISEIDEKDQMIEIYGRVIVWADVVIVATPIRWGSASSLYYQMVQRMNCVQNQVTTHDNYLIRDKVAGFVITGGQDNVQHVAGELFSFWSQLGFVFGKFPFVGWSRGWYAEDTENNNAATVMNEKMQQDLKRMVGGAVEMSKLVKKSRYDERVLDVH